MATPEGKILSNILRFARRHKITYIRLALQPYVETGWPDVVFLLPRGVTFWMEVKRPGKKPTPKQEGKLNALSELGHFSGWFDDADEACKTLTSIVDSITLYDTGSGVPTLAPGSGAPPSTGRA